MPGTVVMGVIFVDIKGFPWGIYTPRGTNRGSVRYIHGGVARNVAEDLLRIGAPVTFVTLSDRTPMGNDALQRLSEQGADLSHAITVAQNGVGIWLAVMDETGDLAGSISQMPDTKPLEDYLALHGEAIVAEADHIAIEFDMGEEIAERITDLAEQYGKDLYCIPGNMSVMLKRPDLLRRTRCVICNEVEAHKIFGRPLPQEDPDGILEAVLQYGRGFGLRSMVVTLGASGAVYYDGPTGESGFFPAQKVKMVDSTGAGDAFFSGVIAGLTRGLPLGRAVQGGTRLAALTIQSEEACCPVIPDLWD